jgi:hypothetical protein
VSTELRTAVSWSTEAHTEPMSTGGGHACGVDAVSTTSTILVGDGVAVVQALSGRDR